MAENTKAVEIIDLEKSYGSLKAVAGISFYVKKGQIFTLLGPNGAGKTTTIEILEGLKEKDGGEIKFFGETVAKISKKEKEEIGVLLQKNNYIEKIKVKEILKMFSSFYKNSLSTSDIIKKISLEDKKDSFVENLSGGQQQRLSIGLALINDPKILYLDEPTTGLDPQARRKLWGLIKDLKKAGKTVFLTTHYMEEAERLSDYVYIMDQGKIIADGSPEKLIEDLGKENVIVFAKTGFTDSAIEELQETYPELKITESEISIYVKDLSSSLTELIKWAGEKEVEIDNLKIRRPNLEDVFIELTGKGLRD
ncbi:ABC-2 type transport system ATP-binding protein [Halanaerobium saccharolyticum]|uniref:ABC-2 type transport system ATP-binding protein n=1 Tax=Halanaerobium saccharolyticum TaxID=43595 RepID=A0A4R7YSC4_9FIRM|nr:ABC transporter ATP-binding protein [Halanaerobium saccharolyticum]RAK10261.1 ABC-2 type transport system ATP-binding protein [Halanaerobium saccharolyticum]TDW00473.1 ABC-2 type transport system ATP-binding protein [Halanaerobium saccharolyticum]TDX52058.1 ABC-2 type transport system ATP-binding protein [Halanaerobium saccharolyticum]